MWTAIASAIGILGAWFAWWSNPKQYKIRLESELEEIRVRISKERDESDKAIARMDGDMLTMCDRTIAELCRQEAGLLQRIREIDR